jgi:sortase A
MTDVVVLPPRAPEIEPERVHEPDREELAAPSARPSGREIAIVIGWGLTVFGALVVAYVIYLVGVTQLEHARSQRSLVEGFNHQLSVQAAPIGGRINEGTPIAMLQIPSAGVHEIVVEGTSGTQLRKGPGHLRSSPLPGQPGNAVIACRRLTFSGPCYDLTGLKPGDRITVTTGQGKSVYRVTDVRNVRRGNRDVIADTSTNRLTMITSQRLLATRRVAVIATLVGRPFAPPNATRPDEIRSSELGLNTEGSDTLAVVLWLQLLLAACLLGVWLVRKQPHVSTYVVMVPVLLMLTLLVFDSVTALLPSTL